MELKPCPFCGSEEIQVRKVTGMFGRSAYARTRKYVLCEKCRARTFDYATKPLAIEAWNRRANDEVV